MIRENKKWKEKRKEREQERECAKLHHTPHTRTTTTQQHTHHHNTPPQHTTHTTHHTLHTNTSTNTAHNDTRERGRESGLASTCCTPLSVSSPFVLLLIRCPHGTVLLDMVGMDHTISPKIITVLTRYRPIVLELIKNCNACNFTWRRFWN